MKLQGLEFHTDDTDARNWFVGEVFHSIQQCGGRLTYNGKQLAAVFMEQTSGRVIGDEEKVYFDNKVMTLGEVFDVGKTAE